MSRPWFSQAASTMLALGLILSPGSGALAEASAAPAGPPLPIRRVMLYKHGVAYFERSGPTDAGSDIVLEFKTSEMNDVLKSLTLLDRGGGRVAGVSYESSDPVARQLEKYGVSLPREASLGQVLDQWKGARLVVSTPQGGELRGRILGVRRTQWEKKELEIAALLLDSGEMRNVVLNEAAELRLEDPRLQRDFAGYLETLAGGYRRDLRTLRIHPGGARELSVGYVVEAPVWKTSYRLVLDPRRPNEVLLQGWAIVENTTTEDWRGVELSLVSGLPVSFTQNLYEPHYLKRPHVPLLMELGLAPVLHEGALQESKDEPTGPRTTDDLRRDREVAKSAIAGGALRSLPASAAAPAELFERTVAAVTQGRELGELFEYRVEKPSDVLRNQSAMIPFVQAAVKAERVLLYDPAAQPEHPYDALLLTNTSGLTLDGGALTVLEGDRYLGEGLIETLKGGDSRPVSFALDLGTRLSTAFDSRQDQVYSVKLKRGVILTQAKNVEIKTYTIRNSEAKTKTLVIEHPVRPGWKLAGDLKPEQTTAKHYRFRVTLPPQQTAKLAVTEESEISNTIALANLTPDLLGAFVRNKALSPEAQKRLEAILGLKERIAEVQRKVAARQEQMNEFYREQERLRQNINNLRGLPGQEAQVNRYAAKLAEQEKVMETMQAGLQSDRQSLRTLQADLDRSMATLEI